jgi:hypothetical protein
MTVFVNFAPIVTGVGVCVRDGLAADSIGGISSDMRVCLLYPGNQIPWDGCQCGQLALAIRNVYGSEVFPALSTQHNQKSCGPQYQVAEVVVSVARCAPMPGDDGEPPACSDLLTAALTLESDRAAVLAALSCCLHQLYQQRQIFAFSIGTSTTVGDLGGCVAVETVFYIGLRNCLCGGT